MIIRESYINKIKPFINKPFIKVLTGIRRSGKSVLLMMLKKEFISMGIEEEQVIYINLESMDFSQISDGKSLYDFVKGKIVNDKKYYILVDEIQSILKWEKAVNAFLVDFNADIYITGSNSKLLSSELATFIAGRYIEISITTLSFKEFLDFKKTFVNNENQGIDRELAEYIRLGGFPVIHTSIYNREDAYKIIKDIYSSIILRDIVQRFGIRNVALLDKIVKFVFENIGSIFSGKSVSDYFKNQQRKVDIETVYNYLNALESAFVIYRIHRYDLKGKEVLQTNEKFYIGDHGLIYALLGYRDRDISGILENIVYIELLRRDYKVYIGKYDDKEIDFVAEKNGERIYIQVAYKLSNESTVEREFGVLRKIKDQYPKYVITMDDFWKDNIDGIRHLHIKEFLMQET